MVRASHDFRCQRVASLGGQGVALNGLRDPSHGLRGLAKGVQEGAAHAFGIVKAGGERNLFDRYSAMLDPFARDFKAQTLDGFGGTDGHAAGKGS